MIEIIWYLGLILLVFLTGLNRFAMIVFWPVRFIVMVQVYSIFIASVFVLKIIDPYRLNKMLLALRLIDDGNRIDRALQFPLRILMLFFDRTNDDEFMGQWDYYSVENTINRDKFDKNNGK